jgi:hypothetical protein
MGRLRLRLLALLLPAACAVPPPARLLAPENDAERGRIVLRTAAGEVLGWSYGAEQAIPHWFPLASPSGRELLVQHPDPYPHHCAMWIADRVQLADGPVVDFYHCTRNQKDPDDAGAGYRHLIRQRSVRRCELADGKAVVTVELQWLVDGTTPVLDDTRTFALTPLAGNESQLDLEFTLRAAHGPVTFHSDQVHYAWPLLRVHPQFSAANGGTLVDDQGRAGQRSTNEQYARWMDYSNTIDGVTEGLAILLPAGAGPRRWLTRDYGCFGPRRPDPQNGTRFVLQPGAELRGAVRILVHRGDAVSGRVAERYRDYVEGR